MEIPNNYSFFFTVWGGLKEANKKNLMSYNLSTKGCFCICLHKQNFGKHFAVQQLHDF